jgi:hypothetical protein
VAKCGCSFHVQHIRDSIQPSAGPAVCRRKHTCGSRLVFLFTVLLIPCTCRSTSGLGKGDGINNHTDKWLYVSISQASSAPSSARRGLVIRSWQGQTVQHRWFAVTSSVSRVGMSCSSWQLCAGAVRPGLVKGALRAEQQQLQGTADNSSCRPRTTAAAAAAGQQADGVSVWFVRCCPCRAISSPLWRGSRRQSPSRCQDLWWHPTEVSSSCRHGLAAANPTHI